MENASDAALGINQTFTKIMKVFGEIVKASVCVIIAHSAAAEKRGAYMVNDRARACEALDIPYLIWESKDISHELKLQNIKDFFAIVQEELKPYPILQLNNLDNELKRSARALQLDPSFRVRTVRKDKQDFLIKYEKKGPQYEITIKVGEQWPKGTGYGTALKNLYVKRVGENIKLFLKCESSGKYIAVPLYLMYIGIFTIVPLYPVFGTREEAKKLMVPIENIDTISELDMEEFFDPIEDTPLPPFEYMMMLARQEKANNIRKTIAEKRSS